jgi:hypothetical protein
LRRGTGRYKTVKVVDIRNWKLGLIHYGIIVAVLLYVALWVLWRQRGYQIVRSGPVSVPRGRRTRRSRRLLGLCFSMILCTRRESYDGPSPVGQWPACAGGPAGRKRRGESQGHRECEQQLRFDLGCLRGRCVYVQSILPMTVKRNLAQPPERSPFAAFRLAAADADLSYCCRFAQCTRRRSSTLSSSVRAVRCRGFR